MFRNECRGRLRYDSTNRPTQSSCTGWLVGVPTSGRNAAPLYCSSSILLSKLSDDLRRPRLFHLLRGHHDGRLQLRHPPQAPRSKRSPSPSSSSAPSSSSSAPSWPLISSAVTAPTGFSSPFWGPCCSFQGSYKGHTGFSFDNIPSV